jgi:predicted dienelactone hydrolase
MSTHDRIARGLAALAIAGTLAIGGLLLFLWIERSSDTDLPTPTGSSAVGRAIYDWRDDATVDPLAPAPGVKREVLVWIWYPAAAAPSAAADDYIPPQMRAAAGPSARGLMSLVTRDASRVHAHSSRNADVSRRQRSYPVVILRGGASAAVTNYTTLAEDLASHGYVVAGIDAPYRTSVVVFPDGRVIRRAPENNPELYSGQEFQRLAARLMAAWTADISFVLDRLTQLNASDPSGRFAGRLDMTHVGVFGHSFGGVQAALFCHDDARCKAAIDIDGAPFGRIIETGLQKPFMFLFSGEGDFSSDAEVRQIHADVQSVYDRVPADRRLRVSIRGANHFTFSDDGAVMKSRLVRGGLRLFGRLKIDGRRQLAVTAYCVHTFFDAYLKQDGPTPGISSPLYPELEVLE